MNNGYDMSEEFGMIAKQDEEVANLLCRQGFYNQSVYYYIQSMEKFIKSFICQKIDVTNNYYANKLRQLGHSLDAAIDFFIEIVSGNDNNLRIQVSEQLKDIYDMLKTYINSINVRI